MNVLKKCVAEFVGTFAIVLGGCGAMYSDRLSHGGVGNTGIGLTFGLIVMAMVCALGHVSGAHFNPAETLAFTASRHFPKREVVPYIAAQCAGAISGAAILAVTLAPGLQARVVNRLSLGVTLPYDDAFTTALLWEFLLTFLLMFVIMGVATDYRAVGKSAGLAIGGTVGFEALFAGPISGASMNPARSLGPALVSGEWSHFGAYVIGPIAGAVAAALLYRAIRCDPAEPNGEVKGCC